MDSTHIYIGVISYLCLLFALCVHEAAHALTADWRGDPSPRLMGRVTLNPLSHIDPVGTVLIPLAMIFLSGGFLIGWAKPVPFNPVNLKNMRRDPVLIALAGPFSNLLLALAAAVALRIAVMVMGFEGLSGHPLALLLDRFILINLVLMIFNLIPVPPLDGHFLLHYFLPPAGQRVLEGIGSFGIIIAVVLLWYTPLGGIFGQVYTVFTSLALWGL